MVPKSYTSRIWLISKTFQKTRKKTSKNDCERGHERGQQRGRWTRTDRVEMWPSLKRGRGIRVELGQGIRLNMTQLSLKRRRGQCTCPEPV